MAGDRPFAGSWQLVATIAAFFAAIVDWLATCPMHHFPARVQQCFLDLFHSFDNEVFVSSESPGHGSLIRLNEKNAQFQSRPNSRLVSFETGH
jgi:hypothetical protein